MSEEYEKKLYWGCYPSSKQYLGAEKADLYCSCTVKTLSQKFSDQEMDPESNGCLSNVGSLNLVTLVSF